jgi:hypothetical protein
MSDLLFIGYHPWLGAGDPQGLSHILECVSGLDPQVLVPGHGPVGTPDSLKLMRQYIRTLDGLARRMVQDGKAEEEIDQVAIPAPFDDWLFSAFFALNMHFLYQRLSGQQRDVSA